MNTVIKYSMHLIGKLHFHYEKSVTSKPILLNRFNFMEDDKKLRKHCKAISFQDNSSEESFRCL